MTLPVAVVATLNANTNKLFELQEGPRYTAMHVAATKNKPEICQVILDVLEDPQFINNLYCQSRHTEESQNSRINFLVDLYLNMPDKGVGCKKHSVT